MGKDIDMVCTWHESHWITSGIDISSIEGVMANTRVFTLRTFRTTFRDLECIINEPDSRQTYTWLPSVLFHAFKPATSGRYVSRSCSLNARHLSLAYGSNQGTASRAVDLPESARSTSRPINFVAPGDSGSVLASTMKYIRVKHVSGTIEADLPCGNSQRDGSIAIDRETITRTTRDCSRVIFSTSDEWLAAWAPPTCCVSQ